MERLFVVYITAADLQEAEKISESILDSKLIACSNILSNMTSEYIWQGKRQKSSEVVIICKTVESKLPELEKHVLKIHSYECPCLVAWPIEYVSKKYSQWVIDSLK